MNDAPDLTKREIARRRTFAIISHPDAGKTTLTEKFLLYAGAVSMAGSVTARKSQRATTSDWMEMERQRGISVSSTVLQFDYADRVLNLLDTPGHKDFSEDTYRVLSAVDSALMVVDAAKGIEPQTRKLFEVCRRRGIPIFTFVNKLDRPARPPLELLDEIERVLGIRAVPANWPVGSGPEFKGVYDRWTRELHVFERTPGGAYKAPESVTGFDDPRVCEGMDSVSRGRVLEELAILEEMFGKGDPDRIAAGEETPVFFGSAMNNFGVGLLLQRFVEMAPPPSPRKAGDVSVGPSDAGFSGFVFKIQANMDPKHRDRVAFVRIVSGRFTRDMSVWHGRSGKRIRLSNAKRLFARDRETVDDAFAGDIVGIVGNFGFRIGDTLSEDPGIVFPGLPVFAPETFAFLRNPHLSNFKRFREGLAQILDEGVAQSFELPGGAARVPLLGAVGPLQFDVLQYRLESEYGAPSQLEPAPWSVARWVAPKDLDSLALPSGAALARDARGAPVLLFTSEWSASYFAQNHAGVALSAQPPALAMNPL